MENKNITYVLDVIRRDGSKLTIQHNNLEALKDVARRYNRNGNNVIIHHRVVDFEVTQYE